MHVPDVTDVNGGRMKAEWFPCLTEDLISLFWVFGRKAEKGAGRYLSAVMLVAMMMIILLTFICPHLLNVCVPHQRPAYINSVFTHIHMWVTDQLLGNCGELSALHKGTLTTAAAAKEAHAKNKNNSLRKVILLQIILRKIISLIWSNLWFRCHHYSAQWLFLNPLPAQRLVTFLPLWWLLGY